MRGRWDIQGCQICGPLEAAIVAGEVDLRMSDCELEGKDAIRAPATANLSLSNVRATATRYGVVELDYADRVRDKFHLPLYFSDDQISQLLTAFRDASEKGKDEILQSNVVSRYILKNGWNIAHLSVAVASLLKGEFLGGAD